MRLYSLARRRATPPRAEQDDLFACPLGCPQHLLGKEEHQGHHQRVLLPHRWVPLEEEIQFTIKQHALGSSSKETPIKRRFMGLLCTLLTSHRYSSPLLTFAYLPLKPGTVLESRSCVLMFALLACEWLLLSAATASLLEKLYVVLGCTNEYD